MLVFNYLIYKKWMDLLNFNSWQYQTLKSQRKLIDYTLLVNIKFYQTNQIPLVV